MFDDDTRINGTTIAEIKKDSILQQRFTHPAVAEKYPLKSVELKVPMGKVTYTIATDANVDKDIIADLHAGFLYSDITRAFSNIVPFRAPYLNLRAKQQHGCFTYHGGKYFEGEEFIKCMKMEEHPFLENHLVKVRIRASDKAAITYELKLSGIRESILYPEIEYQAKDIKEEYTRAYTTPSDPS